MELLSSLYEVAWFVFVVAAGIAVLEGYFYYHFKFHDRPWFFWAGLAGFPLLAWLGLGAAGLGKEGLFAWLFATEAVVLLFFRHIVKGRNSLAYLLLAPAFTGLALLLVYPFVFQIYLSFHDLKLTTIMQWKQTGTLPFVGLRQYYDVFTVPPLAEAGFFKLLGRTLWWTFVNVFFHVLGGFALALMLNNDIRFKGVYRTLLVIPWAMPQVVAVLAMRGEFHSQYGFVNIILNKIAAFSPFLASLGVGPVQWLSDHPLTTCMLINVWLGIPFMMVVILGGLQSISSSYYDAADIDGASYFQKLRFITLPLIKPVLMPAVTLGTVWTFNNINVIYLVTGQAGGTEQADILVSALYKAAFTYNRYSYSAAFAIVIFLILFAISVFYLKTFDAAKEAR
ncbi:MAG: sugar ABC transporter permease [Elusimicrobiales bacterium]|jgi:arabinogalactan oligomer/maltooligosaccharide transport system permease protein|nr:sugar ABC transporter permease [Elusimicrobiales bacterium]